MTTQIKRARNVFMGITAFTAVFSVIYEYFSHGVYSGFMIWAALIPFVGVVLPYTVWLRMRPAGMMKKHSSELPWEDWKDDSKGDSEGDAKENSEKSPACSVYQSAVLTFLLGSIFTGILEIYGTTNRLSKVYWIVGGGLLLVSLCLKVRRPPKCAEKM